MPEARGWTINLSTTPFGLYNPLIVNQNSIFSVHILVARSIEKKFVYLRKILKKCWFCSTWVRTASYMVCSRPRCTTLVCSVVLVCPFALLYTGHCLEKCKTPLLSLLAEKHLWYKLNKLVTQPIVFMVLLHFSNCHKCFSAGGDREGAQRVLTK